MRDALPTERIAKTAYWLANGEGFTVRELADRLGTTSRGARMLLEKVSLALPVVTVENEHDPRAGAVWRICGSDGSFGEE